VGASRKGFVKTGLAAADARAPPNAAPVTAAATGAATARLDAGTAGACAVAAMHGAGMLRVHSVDAVRDAVAMVDAIQHFEVPGE
jgi:dihydropteroate synthase